MLCAELADETSDWVEIYNPAVIQQTQQQGLHLASLAVPTSAMRIRGSCVVIRLTDLDPKALESIYAAYSKWRAASRSGLVVVT